MRYFLPAINLPNLIESLDVGGQPAMNAKYSAFDECANSQVVEDIELHAPRVGIPILLHVFIVKAVYRRDLGSFVVSSQ
jgi:hypothetical protein